MQFLELLDLMTSLISHSPTRSICSCFMAVDEQFCLFRLVMEKTEASSDPSPTIASGVVAMAAQSKPDPIPVSPSIVINIPAQTSPRSARLAHLRPPSPLTPEAMRRINLLTVQEPHTLYDPSKLSPISPSPSITSSTTSDLGSSPRSSVSITTPSSFRWSTYRESKKSSSDFTDVDSDLCKDLFSPSITLSPAPFSPFSDHPAPVSEPRLHFSFDPKSPSFMPSTSSRFLLPPPPAFGPQRERSRSDSDTVTLGSSTEEDPASPCSTIGSAEKLSGSESGSAETIFLVPPKIEGHKHLYKKRLLRKYEEEKGGSEGGSDVAGTSIDIDDAVSTYTRRKRGQSL